MTVSQRSVMSIENPLPSRTVLDSNTELLNNILDYGKNRT